MIEDNLIPSKSKNLKSLSKFNKNNKRCVELDEEYNGLQKHPTSVLSFDAYGNLTSSDDPNVSFSHDLPSIEEFDYIIEGFEASFNPQLNKDKKCTEIVSVLKKPSNIKKISQNGSSDESSLSHDDLQQAFKFEVTPGSGATSRYGRTRKQKVAGDDFLVGTINFNELHKVTSPRKKKQSIEVIVKSIEPTTPSPKKKRYNLKHKGDSGVIVNPFDSSLASKKYSYSTKNKSDSEIIVNSCKSTTSEKNRQNSKNKGNSGVANSLESTLSSWNTIPKFEFIGDGIKKFSSEDEFEQEKTIQRERKVKKSTKKHLQSFPFESNIANNAKVDVVNIKKQIDVVVESNSTKVKRNEENKTVTNEDTLNKELDDSTRVEKRTSPRHKRKCENLESQLKKNTRSNSGLMREKPKIHSSISEVKTERLNNLCNYGEDTDKLDYSITGVTSLSESALNTNIEKYGMQIYSSSSIKLNGKCEPVNDSLNDNEHNLKFIKCSLNDADTVEGNVANHAMNYSVQAVDSSVISNSDSTNIANDSKPEIIKMETLLDEIIVKDGETPSLSKFGGPVKNSELISEQLNIVVEEHENALNSDNSPDKENSLIKVYKGEIECEKLLPSEYIVGDLVWVMVSGSPLWPGLVTNPKDSSNYSKVVLKSYKKAYHIQFLCDNFLVSWSRSSSIIPFEGLPGLLKHLENFRVELKRHSGKFKSCQVKCYLKTLSFFNQKVISPKLKRWHEAITSGESLLDLTRDQRLQKFIGEEEEEFAKKKIKLPRPPKKSETNNNNKDDCILHDDMFSGFEKGSTVQDLKIKRQKLEDKLNNVDFDVYFRKNFHKLQTKNPDISKHKARKVLICRWNKLPVSQQLKYKSYDLNNSFLDFNKNSSSECSSQSSSKLKKTPVTENHHDEASKGTYKLIRNEKVCFLCESVSLYAGGGDMVKCKGPCCGTFHMQCVHLDKTFIGDFKCSACLSGIHECFICKLSEGEKIKCTMNSCGKFYHESCVKVWPQVSKGRHNEKFVCPRHLCHMCAANADDMNDAAARTPPFSRCLRCPTTYHTGEICIAAGSEEISQGFHICTKHMKIPKNNSHHLNVNWCFCCSKGGSLLLCDQCPAAFHAECMNITAPEGSYICEDCENGKFPVYGDIVWVKLGQFRWWPGQVLHPRYIPDNIENLSHVQGMFCVHFFGSDDYYWVSRGRAFHYQEGDQGSKGSGSKVTEQKFQLALNIALQEYLKQNEKRKEQEESRSLKGKVKPAPWVKIDTNKPVGNVKLSKLDPSTATKCDCDPYAETPCGSDERCINRMLMVECIRDVCPAGDRCQNQRFQKRQYPNVFPFKTSERGWGLRTKDFIKKGVFVIEYVGELIDDAEFRRRIAEMHECKEENYYFLTVETDRMIDAGPKGNLARFMNHSCEPNCETQKWTVGDETRVGLFALEDIPIDSEVTFNYNLECVGTDKKPCHCGASRCSGFIGVKVQKSGSSGVKKLKLEKKKIKRKSKLKESENDCFRCGNPGDLILCDKAACPKGYHLECLSLSSLPKGKWWCPWHHCDDCGARAVNRCIMCPNSYCKAHSSEKFYLTTGLENVCLEHAKDEFEALRGQMESAAVYSQKSRPENKVQKCSPDKGLSFPEKQHLLPVTSEVMKKERGFKIRIKPESVEHKQLNCSLENSVRKRKLPQTENFTELPCNKESKKLKLSAKTKIETKKRILKSLSNNVASCLDAIKEIALISPKKVNVTAIDTEHISPKSSLNSRSSTGSDK